MKCCNLQCCANWIYTTCSHPGLCFLSSLLKLYAFLSLSLSLTFSPAHSTVILPIPPLDNSTNPSTLNYALSSSISSIFAYFIQSTTGEPHGNSTHSTSEPIRQRWNELHVEWNCTSKFLHFLFLFYFFKYFEAEWNILLYVEARKILACQIHFLQIFENISRRRYMSDMELISIIFCQFYHIYLLFSKNYIGVSHLHFFILVQFPRFLLFSIWCYNFFSQFPFPTIQSFSVLTCNFYFIPRLKNYTITFLSTLINFCSVPLSNNSIYPRVFYIIILYPISLNNSEWNGRRTKINLCNYF